MDITEHVSVEYLRLQDKEVGCKETKGGCYAEAVLFLLT